MAGEGGFAVWSLLVLSLPRGTEQPVTLALVCGRAVPVMGYVPLLSVWYCAWVNAPHLPNFPKSHKLDDSFVSSKAVFSEVLLVLQPVDLLSFISIGLRRSEAAGTKTRALANVPRSKGSKPKFNLSLKFGCESQIQEVVHKNQSGHCFFLKSPLAKNNVLRYSYK